MPDSADDRVIDSSDDERVGQRRVSGSGQKALKEANFGVDQPWIEWSILGNLINGLPQQKKLLMLDIRTTD